MGTYTDFCVGGYSVLSTKSQVDDIAMTVFRETDRYSRLASDEDDESCQITKIGYSAFTAIVRDRLDVMGFTLARTRTQYEIEIADMLAELKEDPTTAADLYATEIEILESLPFDRWLAEFTEIRTRRIESWQIPDAFNTDRGLPLVDVTPVQRFMLESDRVHWFGFPPVDFRYFLRAVLSTCEEELPVTQDITYLVQAGYYSPDVALAEAARAALVGGVPANTPVVILTEGSTDRAALMASLNVLYPHLNEYFTFMDFSQLNVPGGAPYLVSVVKAFAAAGIANRVIALFDNDTAARSALATLPATPLPATLRVVSCPPISLAAAYPTVGPDGPAIADVNGRAASLELYFGLDVLSQDDGTLTPVQWRGYDEKLHAYQGEVLHKHRLQAKFLKKAARAQATGFEQLEDKHWADMRAVLDTIRNAFE